MFRIGEFSRLTRVSVKMLRHYDEIGLLAPSVVEPSGYRYYDPAQLPRLNRIIALKDLGFSLEAIAALLDAPPDAAARMFALRRTELQRSIDLDTARLRQLDALAAGRDDTAQHDVVLRGVPPCLMATTRCRVAGLGGPITELFERLEAHAAAQRARAAASPLLILHDDEYRESDLDVEAAVPITREVAATREIAVREVEGCATMACVIYRGGYGQMREVLQVLLAWTGRHSMRIAGPLREVYLRFAADEAGYRLPAAFLTETTSGLVTEVQLPVEPGGRP